ncbi:uncharacterized protein YutE (UPF0331/DUF86 family) [Tamilnaduibacter salinus]|uniref:Uncharacterized protein YutE (UPF0331/DUF86 family) n=1 Tax=Tamilnaduibacter salinus TaxID=1484056 RepID=A0A2U1CTC1_9GAMM|nr:DUF86 domain-containing protein [Tamilnaduibacter salinus]PVY69808.1 uncharacterized protein YutE (UPF0331/DUF86 family) [Tamilnaduibacter salinus]
MDEQLVGQKLDSLRRCLRRIESWLPETANELAENVDAQDIISLNLTRAIQLCVDLAAHYLVDDARRPVPQTMGQTFQLLAEEGLIKQSLADNLTRAVGFRNIMIHDYERVNWAIVHALCTERLPDFKDYAKVLFRHSD